MAKKPTIREVASQVGTLREVMEVAKMRIINLETLLSKYFEFKKDEKKFKKFLDKQAEELNKDGASDSVRDEKQQEVPESK